MFNLQGLNKCAGGIAQEIIPYLFVRVCRGDMLSGYPLTFKSGSQILLTPPSAEGILRHFLACVPTYLDKDVEMIFSYEPMLALIFSHRDPTQNPYPV